MNLLEKLTTYTDVSTQESTYLTHGIHPYPAKYIPILPREIIIENSKERNIILDPFCGSGTTLLEAAISGRKSIGIDSNPIATLITKAKTQALSIVEINKLKELTQVLANLEYNKIMEFEIPNVKNINHWFCKNAIRELSFLKNFIDTNAEGNLQDYLFCLYSSIIVAVSNQESNTRYAAKENEISVGGVIKRFCKKIISEQNNIEKLSSNQQVIKNTPLIINEETSKVNGDIIPDNSVDLVVTSPPYPNSYDYYLYHKWRMVWLGYDVKKVQAMEMGSRHEHSSQKAPIEKFETKMIPALENISRVLKPNKLAYFFMGDSIISGDFINMAEYFRNIAEKAGFKFINSASYDMSRVSKNFLEKKNSTNKVGYNKKQHILVFEPVKSQTYCLTTDKIATPVFTHKTVNLEEDTIKDKSIIAIESSKLNAQIHSLGKYPAKFIPEIPRWAVNSFSKKGETVLDPFNGSGTTCVEASLLERNCIGFDISPFAHLLASAKTLKIENERIVEYSKKIKSIKSGDAMPDYKHFENDCFWFPEDNLRQFSFLHDIINDFEEPYKTFFLAILSITVKPCSFLDESQIKVKRDTKKLLNGVPSPIDYIKKILDKNIDSIIEYNTLLKGKDRNIRLINDSALNIVKHCKDASVDLVVTSPPYINAMNYPMNHRYESFLLDLVDPEKSIEHQTQFIGTERVYSSDYNELKQFDKDSLLGKRLNEKLQKIYEQEPKRSFIVYKYFIDMKSVFERIHSIQKQSGKFVLVTGSNTIRKQYIDTYNILMDMLQDIGYEYEYSFHYEIVKNSLKIKRHKSSDIIKFDGVGVLSKK